MSQMHSSLDRARLSALATGHDRLGYRASIVGRSIDGVGAREIATDVGCSESTVRKWVRVYNEGGIRALISGGGLSQPSLDRISGSLDQTLKGDWQPRRLPPVPPGTTAAPGEDVDWHGLVAHSNQRKLDAMNPFESRPEGPTPSGFQIDWRSLVQYQRASYRARSMAS